MSTRRQDNPPTSPWVWSSGADYQDKQISLTFNYNETTHALGNLVSQRDSGCVWSRIEIGLGAQTKTVTVPVGQRTFTPAQIQAATGFTSIEQIWALNITVA